MSPSPCPGGPSLEKFLWTPMNNGIRYYDIYRKSNENTDKMKTSGGVGG